jgi:hypothetical protein
LAGLCLLVASVRGHSSASKSKQTPLPPAGVGAPPVFAELSVVGYGTDVSGAREVAREKLVQAVADFQASQSPPLTGVPSVQLIGTDIKETVLQEKVVVADQKDQTIKIEMQGVNLKVEVTPSFYDRLVKLDRQQRKEDRQWLLARLLAIFAVGFVAVGGYLRLDEATKGYYTGLLRLGAVALVGAVGVGLWYVIG